jgi:hypothetical protein
VKRVGMVPGLNGQHQSRRLKYSQVNTCKTLRLNDILGAQIIFLA